MHSNVTQSATSIQLRGVTRRHAVRGGAVTVALDGLDLDVAPGQAVAICGPSGSGKSTLLQLLGALDAPDAGQVLVDGVDLVGLGRKERTLHRRSVGFVFQRYHLLPALSALDNVLMPLVPSGIDAAAVEVAHELLGTVGLGGREGALPSQLSGGQQQRVAIARALVRHPPLVLADEPTGNLDSRAGAEVVDLLLEMRRAYGTTILLATHDTLVAGRCDRLVSLRDGRLVEDLDLLAGLDPGAARARLHGPAAP